MPIYDVLGNSVSSFYDKSSTKKGKAYDKDGIVVYESPVDYSSYKWTSQWGGKGISVPQGLDIYDEKVFWIRASGNTKTAQMYIFDLSSGTQLNIVNADTYHGNSISIRYPLLYAGSAYNPSRIYVNRMSADYSAELEYTLLITDGTRDCNVCIGPEDDDVVWTLGHTADSSDLSAPFYISKWSLVNMTNNGDGTYTPELIHTTPTPQPSNSFYFQDSKIHDGLLWYASGNGSSRAYIYGVNPINGDVEHTIDLETINEPEGIAFYPDENAYGGYALYVGFTGMSLRKYVFDPM